MTEPHGKEVSCRAFSSPLAAIAYLKLDAEKIFRGFPFTIDFVSNHRNSVSWDAFVDFISRLCEIAGGIERLYDADDAVYKDKITKSYLSLAGHFTNPKSIYWMFVRWLAPMLMRNIKYTYAEISDGRIGIQLQLHEGYRGSLEIFQLWKRGIEIFPLSVGLERSLVEAEVTPFGLNARITLAPSFTLIARLQQAWRALFKSDSTLAILSEQANEIRVHYDEILESRQKIMEQEVKLKLSSQMSSLSKLSALGEMAGGVAHEINNPLAIILGHAQLMLDQLDRGELTQEQTQSGLTRIEVTALRISEIVRGLRVFSRDAGSAPFTRIPLGQIIRDTYSLCGEHFRLSGVTLEVGDIPSELEIECRPVQISQVLLNLLSNSFDAVHGRPSRWVKLEAQDLDSTIQISVTDNGSGVAPESREKLFQPFFTTKPVGSGTGLGLSVSRGLIEAHSGRLEYDAESVNTRFVVTLPKRQSKSTI